MVERLRDPEFRAALPYAVAGLAQGAWRYYVQPELTARRGWMALAAGVVAWDVAAPKGHSLSEGVDTALEANRALTTLAVGYTAAHLLNVLPSQVDLFHHAMSRIKG